MSDVDITVQLPEELVKKAREQGMLNSERIARLLEAELIRIEAWQTLNATLEPVRKAFRDDHAGLSEDEIMKLLNEEIQEVRRTASGDSDMSSHDET